jgi:hypothetical protein
VRTIRNTQIHCVYGEGEMHSYLILQQVVHLVTTMLESAKFAVDKELNRILKRGLLFSLSTTFIAEIQSAPLNTVVCAEGCLNMRASPQ